MRRYAMLWGSYRILLWVQHGWRFLQLWLLPGVARPASLVHVPLTSMMLLLPLAAEAARQLSLRRERHAPIVSRQNARRS